MSNQAKRLSDCPAERLAHCRGEVVPPAGDVEVQDSAKMEFDKLAHAHVLAICRGAAAACTEQHSYMQGAKTDSKNWFPHKWVIDAIRNLIGINQSTCLTLRDDTTRLQAEVSALQQRLNIADQRVCDLEKDKQRLDALEGNFWDVRHHSAPLADTGDYTGGVEIVGRWMDKPHERVIGEAYNESLRAAIDQAMTADAYPPARPEYPEIDAALSEENWHMNPCKQGHGDVGACGGKAFCHTCDETITATTTQEAFKQWNATHPASPQ